MEQIRYAGIGSRKTPSKCLEMMTKIGRACARRGYILRSGSALGADQAFERGCDLEKGSKEIWHPNQNSIQHHKWAVEKAREVCWEFPYSRMKPYTRDLLVRNVFQILGDHEQDLSPVKFVVFYCEGDPLLQGRESGGTRYAVRIAHSLNIPFFNLRTNQLDFAEFLRDYPNPPQTPNPF